MKYVEENIKSIVGNCSLLSTLSKIALGSSMDYRKEMAVEHAYLVFVWFVYGE